MFETQKTALGLNPTRILVGVGIGLVVLCCMFSGGFWYVWIGFLVVMLILHLIRDVDRTKQIRKFASDARLTFIGNSLPRYFPVQYTTSHLAHSISRVVVGEDVLIFDCRIGHGKGSRGRTVVAVRGEPEAFGWARFGPDLETEQAGEWTLVYGSNRLLELEEIRALMSEFSLRHVSER
jgi:hypothetical protein